MASFSLNPSGHVFTHSPVSIRLKYKHALQSVGSGSPVEVLLQPNGRTYNSMISAETSACLADFYRFSLWNLSRLLHNASWRQSWLTSFRHKCNSLYLAHFKCRQVQGYCAIIQTKKQTQRFLVFRNPAIAHADPNVSPSLKEWTWKMNQWAREYQ